MQYLEIMGITSIAEFGGLLVAVFGAFGALLIGFYKFAKDQMVASREEREKEREAYMHSLTKFSESIDANTEATRESTAVSKETKEFLVNLNGSLKKIVKEKQDKQNG